MRLQLRLLLPCWRAREATLATTETTADTTTTVAAAGTTTIEEG